MSLDQYSNDEYTSCFYSDEEFHQFKRKVIKVACHLENNNVLGRDNRKLYYRGAERYTTETSCLVRDRRRTAYDIVYKLQDEHPEFMAKCLLSNSMDSQKEACDRGIADQLDAMKAFEKNDIKLKLSPSSSCHRRQMVDQARHHHQLQPANRAA